MAKAPTKKPAAKPGVKADGQNQMNTAAAVQAEETKSTAGNIETGKTPKELRAEWNEKFEKADAKAQAALTEEVQVGLQVRGY